MPHVIAALVLAVAGVAKLRSPQAAAAAVALPGGLIRSFAVGELALAAVAVITASAWSSAVMAAVYAGFALLTLRLARQGGSCGCFGAREHPASAGQSLLSAALGGVSLLSAAAGPHALGWILGRPVASTAVVILGTAAAVYAIVLAYSEVPQLWGAWRPAA